MRWRFAAFVAVLLAFVCALPVAAQVQTASITGKVTDDSGAVLPGVTVTLTGPGLIRPLVAVTSENGTYQFPRIEVGTYSLRFELPGFKTVVRENVRVTLGFTAEINQQLAISTVQETVTVTGESPIVDTKSTTAKTSFDLEMLQNLPSARDPWVMLEKVPNIAMDRVNVGGSQSGQQSGYISRGSGSGNNKWALDGVDITDMSATGASPIYYDFDMIQEMQVVTGGADAAQQTGGVGINFVTRSGTNRFKGSGRLYNTNERFQANNVTDEIRQTGAGSGNPIQNINDVGFELGGPILHDKLWYWGSFGRQDINVGVVNFYEKTDACQSVAKDPLSFAIKDVNDCLATDKTLLNNYNWKVTAVPFQNNKFNFQNTWAEKVRNARDASDRRPLETAYRQKAVDSTFGKFGWTTGPSPIWKASDQHIFTDRFLVEVQAAHVGNNFTLTFQDPSQRSIQPVFDEVTEIWGRSFNESVFLRPTDSLDFTTSYFLPAVFGGDHAFKAGYRYRTALGETISHTGGNAVARFTGTEPTAADLFRDGFTKYDLDTQSAYVQDTFTKGRITANLGLRWDSQKERALPTTVPANPIIPDIMPGINFPGVDSGVTWNDWSPRLGLNYDLFGNGRSIVRASYSAYYGQMGPGQLSQNLLSVNQVSIRYPWTDVNGDRVVQRNELDTTSFITKSSTFDPANPTSFASPGAVDPNIKNDRTREFILGYQREVARNIGLELNYIWRKYDRFQFDDRVNWDSSNFQAVSFTPTNCSAEAICGPITFYKPTSRQPSAFITTNQPDRYRNYNGVELAVTKRYSDRWMGNFSFAFNDATDYWGSPRAFEDPTNIDKLNGHEFAPQSGGSGLDSVFTNAKWLMKASGMYSLPWAGVNVAANTNYHQGYPFPTAINVTTRGGGLGTATVLLEPLGDIRLPNTFTLDLRVDKVFQFGAMRMIPSVDVFNVTNANTVQSRRRVMYTLNGTTLTGSSPTNANQISSIIAPRVVRFGVRVNW